MKLIRRKKFLFFGVVCIFVLTIFFLCKYIIKRKTEFTQAFDVQSMEKKQSHSSEKSTQDKMFGVWVPYMDLEIGSRENFQEKFEKKFQEIIKQSKKRKINTLIVHVRSHGDAMYPSEIFPWSHLITGTQGQDPHFDPLQYMIDTTHKNKMEFHAWINPLRIQGKEHPKEFSSNNPYFKLRDEKYFIRHSDGICYNPAYSQTRDLIVNGVKEIIQKYDVDGIHFDDYFYPEEKSLTSKDVAYEEYLKSTEENKSLESWRKLNIQKLIQQVHDSIKKTNSKIKFGVSPPGNIKKCHEAGADVKSWVENNYVDYICPQIYWSTDFELMPFEKTASLWKKISQNTPTKLYCGLALYKIGTNLDCGTWKNKNDILAKEMQILKKLGYEGTILYSWGFLNSKETSQELENLQKEMDLPN